MAKGEIVIAGRELLHAVTLTVRMPRLFGLRMWMATRLFELAGLVSGTNVVIEIDDYEDDFIDRVYDHPIDWAAAGHDPDRH